MRIKWIIVVPGDTISSLSSSGKSTLNFGNASGYPGRGEIQRPTLAFFMAPLGVLLGAFLLFWEPTPGQAACTGTSNCSNQTLTLNNNLGGVGYSGNHVNIDTPLLTCGSGGGGWEGWGRGGCRGPDAGFNDTSGTGTTSGICLTLSNVSDPQCLRIPPGANPGFGFGLPPGGSNSSLFQSFNGGFSETDSGNSQGGDDDRGGYATTFTFGKAFTESIVSKPDPSNPSHRIHTIQQTVGFNIGEGDSGGDRNGGRDGYSQITSMTFSISTVTDSKGNMIGSQNTDPNCKAQPTGACGNFSMNIFDSRVSANCNSAISTGVFTIVTPPSGGGGATATATFTAPTGVNFTLACTTESGPNGCVGPVLDPSFYTPGGQFRTPPNCP